MNTQTPSDTHQNEQANKLRQLGWDNHFERLTIHQEFNLNRVARVLSAQRDHFLVTNGHAEWLCTPSGKLRHHRQQDYPVTGDWVLTNTNVIEHVFVRKNILCRGGAGSHGNRNQSATRKQPIGANIETAFIVCGLDRDYNLRRIERYLALVYNCDITPVVVLTKSDLHNHPQTFQQEVEGVAFDVPIVLTSMITGDGVDDLHTFLGCGQTVAMIGSSGAGKSTLTNLLYGNDIQTTTPVSTSIGKGRHTTTARELIRMPQGGMLMDNPGIREIAFSANEGGVEAAFPDIRHLAELCRFSNCTHKHEPGCAVLQAVRKGELEHNRLKSYHKMIREMAYASDRSEKSADRLEKERWRDRSLQIRQIKKKK